MPEAPSCSYPGCSVPVLLHEAVHEALAVGGCGPRVRPEAQVDGPPVVLQRCRCQKFRHDLVKVQNTQTEWRVCRGLVFAIRILMTGVVAVDQVDVVDAGQVRVFQHGNLVEARHHLAHLLEARLQRGEALHRRVGPHEFVAVEDDKAVLVQRRDDRAGEPPFVPRALGAARVRCRGAENAAGGCDWQGMSVSLGDQESGDASQPDISYVPLQE